MRLTEGVVPVPIAHTKTIFIRGSTRFSLVPIVVPRVRQLHLRPVYLADFADPFPLTDRLPIRSAQPEFLIWKLVVDELIQIWRV